MSSIDDAAAKRLEEERDRIEISPAQPSDSSRIDDDHGHDARADEAPPAHVKHDAPGRMAH
jgi:hypothetical protein